MNYKNFLLNFTLVFFSILIALIFVEIFLRINDQGPWGNLDTGRNDPTINKPDKELGWVPKKGKYKFEAFSDTGEDFEINITEDGSRKTENQINANNKKQVIFLGGSVPLGWGINDNQTFISKLQKRLSNYNLKNFSAGGYGTYQSFLRLEKIMKNNLNVKVVIISYLPHHATRNIGDEFWLRTLTKYSKRGYVSLPYASIDKYGELKRIDPIVYFKMPLMNHLSVSNKISKRIMISKLKNNSKNAYKVTNLIFSEMVDLLNKKKIKLVVLDLSSNKKSLDPYLETFKKKGINYINCNIEQTDELTIKGDGHPNGKMHSLYSDCIFKGIRKFI